MCRVVRQQSVCTGLLVNRRGAALRVQAGPLPRTMRLCSNLALVLTLRLAVVPSDAADADAGAAAAAAAATASLIFDASLEQKVLTSAAAKTIPDRRFDMCARAQAIHDGELQLGDALAGVHLNFIIDRRDDPLFFDLDASLAVMPGMDASLMYELSLLGNFSYSVTPIRKPETVTYTELLERTTAKYDLMLNWWLVTEARMSAGMRSPFAFYQLSSTAAKRWGAPPTFVDNILSVLGPFTPRLWVSVLGATVLTALVYLYVEGRANEQDALPQDTPRLARLGNAIYLGVLQITGAGGYTPVTGQGKILLAGYSIFILFVVNSYTANLAAAMVVKGQGGMCTSFEECAGQNGDRICLARSTATDALMTEQYGSVYGDQFVKTDLTPGSEWTTEAEGKCELVVMPKLLLDIEKVTKRSNSACTITQIGYKAVVPAEGGWHGKADYRDRCTSTTIDAMASLFLTMRNTGRLDALKASLISRATTLDQPCAAFQAADSLTFDVMNLLGPLLLLAAVILCVLACGCANALRGVRHNAVAASDESATVPNAPSEMTRVDDLVDADC